MSQNYELSLVNIQQIRTLIEKENDIEKLLVIKEFAHVEKERARARGLDDIHALAWEIEERAKRRVGIFLKAMPKSKGGEQHHKHRSEKTTSVSLPTLVDVGVTKDESSDWQKLASIPESKFEEFIQEGKEEIAKADARIVKRLNVKENNLVQNVIIEEGTFSVIYADPPWQFENSATRASAVNHYPTMPTEDICLMRIPSAEDSVLFLWATNAMLKDALEVMEAWGFEYKTNAVWIKDKIGLGNYFRNRHELLLLGTKGKPIHIEPKSRKDSVIEANRLEHSRKPILYSFIEEMYPNSKYLELFARNVVTRKNWTFHGNQIIETASIDYRYRN